jgi:isopentenyldiphosphate isomerase
VDTEPALAFVYQAAYGEFSENEYCVLMVGRYRGVVRPNPEHAYDLQWVSYDSCVRDIARDPDKYTPWARIAIDALEGHPLTRSVAAAA